MFEPELRRVLYPLVAASEHDSLPLPLDELVASITGKYPSLRLDRLTFPERADEPLSFRLYQGEDFKKPCFALVDPHTGRVLKSGGLGAFPIELLMWTHADLLLGESGEAIVGVFGVALAVLGVTGLTLWWPGLRRIGARLRIRWNAPRPRMLLELHTVTGARLRGIFGDHRVHRCAGCLRGYLPLRTEPAGLTAHRIPGSDHASVAPEKDARSRRGDSLDAAVQMVKRGFPEARIHPMQRRESE